MNIFKFVNFPIIASSGWQLSQLALGALNTNILRAQKKARSCRLLLFSCFFLRQSCLQVWCFSVRFLTCHEYIVASECGETLQGVFWLWLCSFHFANVQFLRFDTSKHLSRLFSWHSSVPWHSWHPATPLVLKWRPETQTTRRHCLLDQGLRKGGC